MFAIVTLVYTPAGLIIMKIPHYNIFRPIALGLLALIATTNVCLAQTPVALYSLDQPNGSAVVNTGSLGSAKNASLIGPAIWSTDRKEGSHSLSLNGSAFAQIPGPVVNTSASFTAAAWVKLNSLGAFEGVLSIDGRNVSGFYLEFNQAIQKFAFTRFASDDINSPISSAEAIAAPVVGRWYHVAGVYDSNAKSLALYINGVLQHSASYPASWSATGNTVIGRTKWNATPLSFLNGQVDDVRFYSSALSAAQIQTLTTASCAPTAITPYVQLNGGSWAQTATATVAAGGSVKFGPQPVSGGSWTWSGPNGFSATTREIILSTIAATRAGTYIATYTNACGAKTTQVFNVTVTGGVTNFTLSIKTFGNGSTSPAAGTLSVAPGTVVTVTATPSSGNTFSGWSGAATGNANPVSLTINASTTLTASFAVDTGGGDNSGGFFTWPTYSPVLAYDYVDEFGTLNPPAKVAEDVTGVAGTYANGWWCFRYGANKNPLVTAAAWVPMIAHYNTDFNYISDVMRWPRDSRARSGNYSAVYLYGSGLSTDTASNTALGGWQSWAGNGPIVLASYYPVYSFDPACPFSDRVFQQGAMTHEGIHCILSTMPGCKNAAWFQEGGNTWLQGTMESQRTNDFSHIGFLSAGAAIAPFMPIECYSGWLQDGSFGGPSAERVNRFNGTQQICTWRNLLGGNQYGECFPHALEVMLGFKSVAWVWRNCSASGRVLQDMAEVPNGLGPVQTRRLIQEFRARQAMCDFGKWSGAIQQLLVNNWNISIGPEFSPFWIDCPIWKATCYVATAQNGITLTPEDRTLPGWSGANQIPLTVSGSTASVTFNPIGANMSCQLVYRDTSGAIHYSTPVTSGLCSIPLSNVKNNVVIAVVCNTNYIYDGGVTKYAYTLALGAGVTGKADIYTQWFK